MFSLLFQGFEDRPLSHLCVRAGCHYPFLTQKERDIETGLDYFLARYYSSNQGRFTSADNVAGRRSDPQSLNLYASVLNNPLAYTDPTGHMAEPGSYSPVRCFLSGGMGCNGEPMSQTGQGRPGTTKPQVPEGWEIRADGSLARKGAQEVLGDVTVKAAKRGILRRAFSFLGRHLGWAGGPVVGAAIEFGAEMADPQLPGGVTGGGDADLGPASMPWMTPKIQGTFAGNVFNPHRLELDNTFYRYFGPTPMVAGEGVGYFSTQIFSNSKDAVMIWR